MAAEGTLSRHLESRVDPGNEVVFRATPQLTERLREAKQGFDIIELLLGSQCQNKK